MLDWFFVYGTLLRGEGAAAHAQFAAHAQSAAQFEDLFEPRRLPARVDGELVALPEGYPMLLSTGGGTVVGEIARARDVEVALRSLDRYEDVAGGLYARVEVRARLGQGEEQAAWAYVCPQDATAAARARGRPVPGGDWRAFAHG